MLEKPMLLIDGHLDLAWNAVNWNRDLQRSIEEIRQAEVAANLTDAGRQTNTLSLPELRHSGMGLCLTTLLSRVKAANHPLLDVATVETCYAMAMAQLEYYRVMCRKGAMRQITSRHELEQHWVNYQANPQTAPLGFILSMECADPVLDPDHIHYWWQCGLRFIGITHYGMNRYGGGTNCEAGLTDIAPPLLRNIEKLGMVLDCTHLSDAAFWQVMDLYQGRVIASHQNARRFCDWQRQFSDEQLLEVIRRAGIIGTALDVIMLQPNFVRGVSKPEVTLERAVDNIDHVCQLAGNVKHAALGTDLDGGFGYEQTPADVNRYRDVLKLADMLTHRGYSQADVEAIFHGNWLRLFEEVLPSNK